MLGGRNEKVMGGVFVRELLDGWTAVILACFFSSGIVDLRNLYLCFLLLQFDDDVADDGQIMMSLLVIRSSNVTTRFATH